MGIPLFKNARINFLYPDGTCRISRFKKIQVMPAEIVPWILMLIASAGLCARSTWSLWCIEQQVFQLQITGLSYVKHEHNTQVATTDLFSSFVQTAIIHGTLGSSPIIESAARYSHRAHKKISSKVLNITLGGLCWIVVDGDRICHYRLHGPSCNLLPGSHHSGNLNGCVCYKEIWAQFTEHFTDMNL